MVMNMFTKEITSTFKYETRKLSDNFHIVKETKSTNDHVSISYSILDNSDLELLKLDSNTLLDFESRNNCYFEMSADVKDCLNVMYHNITNMLDTESAARCNYSIVEKGQSTPVNVVPFNFISLEEIFKMNDVNELYYFSHFDHGVYNIDDELYIKQCLYDYGIHTPCYAYSNEYYDTKDLFDYIIDHCKVIFRGDPKVSDIPYYNSTVDCYEFIQCNILEWSGNKTIEDFKK